MLRSHQRLSAMAAEGEQHRVEEARAEAEKWLLGQQPTQCARRAELKQMPFRRGMRSGFIKGKAYAEYGDAAMVQLIVKELPGIAHAVAAPLCKAEKMVFVSGDGSSASKLTGDIGNIMAQLPDTVQALTGVNLRKALKRVEGGSAGDKA